MSLEKACIEGKSRSTGGLNLPELKSELVSRYPEHRDKILTAGRKDLEALCKQLMGRTVSPPPSPPKKVISPDDKKYFTQDAPAIYQDSESMPAKYCRCIAHIAKKQPDWCLKEKAWFKKREGKTCYNPYAICTKNIGRKGNVECFPFYDLNELPEDEQTAFMYLNNKNTLGELYQAHQEARAKYGLSVSERPTKTVKKKMMKKIPKLIPTPAPVATLTKPAVTGDCDCRYKGAEPSPKGRGFCAHCGNEGEIMKGTDGNMWIIKRRVNGSLYWAKHK